MTKRSTARQTYNAANRLVSVTGFATLPSSTGIVTTYTYDGADRLTGISHVKDGSTTVASFAYTLDDVGNRTGRVDQQGTHAYAYADLYRLTSVTYPGPSTTSYAFDAFGNRTSMTDGAGTTSYTYDDADRITAVQPPSPALPVSYTWDDNGNLTNRGSDTFAWDYEDRMVSDTVNSVTSTYTYRGDGLRDSRTVGMTTTTFTWDIAAGLPVVLDDGNQYLYGAGLSAMKQGSAWSYYLADGLGSTMAVVDASGTVQKSYQYDVYGEVTGGSGSLANEFDFAGQQTDPTGLQYLRARYYDPGSGVFLSRDLLEDKGGTGMPAYLYGAASPAMRRDPTGLAPWDDPEARWCAARPWWWARCAAGGALAAFAKKLTDVLFGEESDRSDAFRHCIWSACLTIDMGAGAAKTLTNLHEHYDPSGNRQQQRKDLWNNEKGRDIGKKYAGLGEYGVARAIVDCLSALDSGGLIIDPAMAPYYGGEEEILPGGAGVGGGSW